MRFYDRVGFWFRFDAGPKQIIRAEVSPLETRDDMEHAIVTVVDRVMQFKGLDVPGARPYFVVRVDAPIKKIHGPLLDYATHVEELFILTDGKRWSMLDWIGPRRRDSIEIFSTADQAIINKAIADWCEKNGF